MRAVRAVRAEGAAGGATPLVGRAHELRTIAALWDGLSAGSPRVLLIEGEAGVGKSALLLAALADARQRGFDVQRAAGEELEHDLPFGVLAQALELQSGSRDPERAAIGRLLAQPAAGAAVPASLAAPELRFQVVEAIVGLVERLALDSPVVLAVDDLQWADTSSLAALHQLARRLAHVPLAVVGAFRPVPQPPPLTRTLAALTDLGAHQLMLAPLDGDEVVALVRHLTGEEPGAGLLRLVTAAAGNPFYVRELVAGLAEDATRHTGGVVATPTLPAGLRLTVLRRLALLGEGSTEVLQVAAVLGSSFSPADLSTVLARPVTDLLPVLTDAARAGVLRDAGEKLAFRHDLVREALYDDMPLAVRKAVHLQAGHALAAAGRPTVQVATHLALGAQPGDGEAVAWLRRAARDVVPHDAMTAADLLRRASELVRPGDGGLGDVLVELAWALLWSGQLAQAEECAREALARMTDASGRGVLHYVLAKSFVAQGRIVESIEQLEAGLEAVPADDPVRARLLGDLALRRFHARDVAGSRRVAEQVLAASDVADAAFATCAAMSALSVVHAVEGQLEAAGTWAERAVRVAQEDATDEAALVGPGLYFALYAIAADRLDDARRVLDDWQRRSEGQVFSPIAHVVRSHAAFLAGAWDDAETEAETGLALADELGSGVFNVFAYATLAHVALRRGDPACAQARLNAAAEELGAASFRFGLAWLRWTQALFEEAAGDDERALATLAETWGRSWASGMPAECPELAPDLVRLLLAEGRRHEAHTVATRAGQLAGTMRTGSARVTALRCKGLLTADPQVLVDAVAQARTTPRVLDLALACEDAGRLLAEAGDLDDALPLLHEAAGIYERLGAVRDAARADGTLRGHGVRRRRGGRAARPPAGTGSLTPTERQVVRLTAQGLTNRQIGQQLFISPRTVGTHLSHVFAKLGVSTRAELAAAVARRPEIL